MEKTLTQENTPFLAFLKDAKEVRVHELSSGKQNRLVFSLQEILRDFDKNRSSDAYKSFLVHVKVKPQFAAENVARQDWTRDTLVRKAELLLSHNDHLLARNIYSYLLKKNIRDPVALKGLGICLYRLSDTSSAKRCFQALWELYHPEDSLAWLGHCCVAEHKDELAIEYFQRVDLGNSAGGMSAEESFDLFKELGNCQTRLGRFDEAAKSYSRALQANNSSDVIHVNLGILEMQRSGYELANHHFQKASELNPTNPKAICGLGLVAMTLNDLPKAETHFYRTLEIDSQNVSALLQIVAIAHLREDYSKTKFYLLRFLENDSKNPEIHYALAGIFFKESLWTDCEKEVEVVLKLDSQHSKAKKLREEVQKVVGSFRRIIDHTAEK